MATHTIRADEHTLLMLFEQLPLSSKLQFLMIALTRMSGDHILQIRQFMDSLTRCDFISLLYDYHQYHICDKILGYLDLKSLKAAELVNRKWQRMIELSSLWRKLFERHLETRPLWGHLVSRLNLEMFFSDASMSRASSRWSLAESHYSHFSNRSTHGDYDCQKSEFYRRMFNCMCRIEQRVQQNWEQGKFRSRKLECHTEGSRGVYCIQYDNERLVCGMRDGTIHVYDPKTLQLKRRLVGHAGFVLCLQFENQLLVTGGSDSTVRIWSLDSYQCLRILRYHRNGIFSLRFCGQVLITGSKDGAVGIWHIRCPTSVEFRRALRGHQGAVNVVDFDDRFILSAGGDHKIQVWDYETYDPLHALVGHRRGVTCMQFTGKIVASGSSDLTVRVWNVETGLCLRLIEGHEELVRCIRFDEQHLLTGSYDGKIRMWNMEHVLSPGKPHDIHCTATLNDHRARVFKVLINPTQAISCSLDNSIILRDFLIGIDEEIDTINSIVEQAKSRYSASSSISSLDPNFIRFERTVIASASSRRPSGCYDDDDGLETDCESDIF